MNHTTRTIDSDTIVDASNGWHWWRWPMGFPIEADTVDGKYFYIANTVQEGHRLWASLTSGMHDPGKTHVLTKEYVLYNRTHYSQVEDIIRVENCRYKLPAPDCYDRDPILHELGHRLAFTQQFFDDVPDTLTIYSPTSIVTFGLAANEGFAEFWCALADMNYWGDLDSVHDDSFNDFLDTTFKNYESGKYGQKGDIIDTVIGTFNALGPQSGGAVAGILWDIYDDTSDNFSGQQDWGDTLLPHHPDGVWDSLSDGAGNIIEALINRTIDGHRPDNILEFWDAWFQPEPLGHRKKMGDIWYEHGDTTHLGCCMGDMRGNVNYDPNDEIDIADVVYMVDFMFDGGPAPSCWAEADIDASGGDSSGPWDVDISDLVVLTDYMFSGGVAPWPCP